jgi:hypothetical protein
MKLTGRKDVEAPADFVFATLTDFESWERFAMRRGMDVSRTDTLAKPGPGMGWLVIFEYRGKKREMRISMDQIGPGAQLKLRGQSPNVEGECQIEVVEMSTRRCRLHLTLDGRPRTLGARLFMQSLRLAKGRVDRRFDGRLEVLAQELESRLARGPGKT